MLTVVKIGGAVLENDDELSSFLSVFSSIAGKKVLVHGGGRTSSELMEKLGIQPVMLDGRRVTDAVTLQIVTLAYSGLNKQLVAKLQARKCKAIGLTGADENLLKAVKRPPNPIDFGWVGDISKSFVNTNVLMGYLNHEIVPVLAPLTHDGKGNLLNTNADTIASVVAQALGELEPVRLIYAFEKAGLLWDSEDESTLIPEFHKNDLGKAQYDGHIHAGMIPKLNNAFHALENGVSEVLICKTNQVNKLEVKTILKI